jgi:predicted dehydrogenase
MSDRPVRVGQVGLGWFGSIHAQTWLRLRGVQLVGVHDRDVTRLHASGGADAQNAFHVATAHEPLRLPEHVARHADLDSLLSIGIDVLDVVVDERAHADIVRRALLAGVDVIVEKPLAVKLHDVRELIELAEACQRNLYVGHLLRFDVRNATVASLVHGASLRHLSFQRNFQTIAHQVYGRVHPVYAAAVHDIDLAVWYSRRRPQSVTAFASNYLGGATPDVLDIVLHWGDGLRAIIQNSWHLPPSCPYGFEFECKVQTENGTYVVRNEPDVQIWDSAGVASPDMYFWPTMHNARVGAIRAELEHFTDCVRERVASPQIPLEHVLWTAEVSDAVLGALAEPEEGPIRL